jgi:putative Mn2+ efflux pump MntP
MNNFEIIILALALVFNSWAKYLNAGVALSKEPFLRKVHFAGIMFFFQFVMAGVGIWAGYKVCSFEVRVNMLISLSILLILGLTVLLAGITSRSEENPSDFTDNKVTLFTALAEGITPLFIGLSIGLLTTRPYLHWIVTGVFLIFGILLGLMLANRMGARSLKFRVENIAGFLLLAVAFKLIISLTGY